MSDPLRLESLDTLSANMSSLAICLCTVTVFLATPVIWGSTNSAVDLAFGVGLPAAGIVIGALTIYSHSREDLVVRYAIRRLAKAGKLYCSLLLALSFTVLTGLIDLVSRLPINTALMIGAGLFLLAVLYIVLKKTIATFVFKRIL
ncbi:hypothetical protein FMN50_14345 [Rhodobacterales bacterium]|nr:hypothetical protein FMN50_14345 [Rhodobacterales bacterium]